MPLVEIKWWSGRDDATKAKAIKLVTEAVCEACGCAPDVRAGEPGGGDGSQLYAGQAGAPVSDG